MNSMDDQQDVQSVWEEFWFPIVGNNIEEIKKELFDYYHLILNAGMVYDHVTGGACSNQMTRADVVIGLADEFYDGLIREDVEEEKAYTLDKQREV